MACSVQAFRFLLEFPKKLSYMPSQKTNDTITEKIHFSSCLPLLLLFLVLPPSPVSLPTSSFVLSLAMLLVHAHKKKFYLAFNSCNH